MREQAAQKMPQGKGVTDLSDWQLQGTYVRLLSCLLVNQGGGDINLVGNAMTLFYYELTIVHKVCQAKPDVDGYR